MLDAFIIEKIKRDRERAGQERRLQIEKLPPPAPPESFNNHHGRGQDEDAPKRGTIVIDFTV